jgi:outer membrane receptor for ferric coprogen and ferric-rhodotorulic acid
LTLTAYHLSIDTPFDMILKGMVSAQADVQFGLHPDENTIQSSYAIYDASMVLQNQGDSWKVTVFVKNITDKFYASAIQSSNERILPNGYLHRYSALAERTYGLELRYRWM